MSLPVRQGSLVQEPAPPPVEVARRRPGGRWRNYWYAYAMVAPVLLVLAVLIVYPLARGVVLTLTDATNRNIGNPRFGTPDRSRFVGLHNYVDILTNADGAFYPVLLRTVIWTAACVALHYGLGMALAMMLNREFRGRGLYRILLVLPWATPAFVSAFAWRFLFNTDNGLVNRGLGALGVGRLDWLGQSNLTLVAVIVVNVWLGVPFMMVALLGGLQSIPSELYEAAEVDGATPWQRFRYITLPGLRSVSASVILLGTIWTFNMFPVIYLVTGTNQYSQILVTHSYNLFYSGQLARSATYGVVILSLLIVFASGYRQLLKRQGEVV